MEFIVLVVAFIGLLMALNARKRGASLQLQLNSVLTRLSRLQDELEDLRRGPQAPTRDAAAPDREPPEVPEVGEAVPPAAAEAAAEARAYPSAPPSVPDGRAGAATAGPWGPPLGERVGHPRAGLARRPGAGARGVGLGRP